MFTSYILSNAKHGKIYVSRRGVGPGVDHQTSVYKINRNKNIYRIFDSPFSFLYMHVRTYGYIRTQQIKSD